ncbi:MAG TPA: uroporphyrinogen-III synthase [Edaphobacter sp.]|nr:uroporphyrinogen-III synthase [Edaphobacter sp.]
MVESPKNLQGKRILITRIRQQASELAAKIEALGGTPILVPTIEIAPPQSYAALDTALAELESFDWIVFTSANAVEVFHQRRNPALTPGRIAVIGPATARAVEQAGMKVSLMPPVYVAESLAETLAPMVRGKRILFVRAEQARDVLPEGLKAAGAHVTIAAAYRNQIPAGTVAELRSLFAAKENYPDAITFTSASTARNLAELLQEAEIELPASVGLVSIGPITSEALRSLRLEPDVEATEPGLPALVDALLTYINQK